MAVAQQRNTDWLDGLSLPQSGFTAPLRNLARSRLETLGAPKARDEYWRYTNPAPFLKPIAVENPAKFVTAAHGDVYRLCFVDGVFQASLSDDISDEPIAFDSLADLAQGGIHWARDYYGYLEAGAHKHVARPFAAFNSAYAQEGALLHVMGEVSKPILIEMRSQNAASGALLHHVVLCEPHSKVRLIESGNPGSGGNLAMEIFVSEAASCDLIRLQGPVCPASVVSHLFAELGPDAALRVFSLGGNAQSWRNESVINLTGDNGAAHIAGAYLADGVSHHDDTVFITHDAVGCESRQVFKKVLRNGAVGVFQGKILVKPDAQKTDGYQISQSLLLDDDSKFLAKPELEIYADDVACSHGSTTGAIDADALYYLRARGISLREAQKLMILAFLAEAVEEIGAEEDREQITEILRQWLEAPGGA